MKLDEKDQTFLKKLHESNLDYTEFQKVYANFVERIYEKYKLNTKKYFTIRIWPEKVFGEIVLENRNRVLQAKKISKSDQKPVDKTEEVI